MPLFRIWEVEIYPKKDYYLIEMLTLILILLVFFWLTGYISAPWLFFPSIVLFYINGRPVTLWNTFIIIILLWAISILPQPLKNIVSIMLIFWILSLLGIIIFTGFSNLILTILILGLILHLIGII